MDATAQLDRVLQLFEQLGIEVRREQLGGSGGGLCKIRGQRVVFVDLDADSATRLDRCVEALASLPEAATLYIAPDMRERMDRLHEARADDAKSGA